MVKATSTVRFARDADGGIRVTVPPDLHPLDDFLETDLGDSASALDQVVGRVRDGGADPWAFGGDCCHLTVHADEVLIENDFTGARVTLSRAEFLAIADDFARAVHEPR
ncbi:MAG TPA: hypothetical protein VFV67_09375 [Actinophytocola sp.]|uniref:hypothetical protein n=1 Tax=Actinophytocola sp. TaxID=1872138 RepID=UPI002DB645E2|nr:hypothetical protein [Actinophytocola sp.]HEU5470851.1 hypothetical protein [Actinophytocola sp.]